MEVIFALINANRNTEGLQFFSRNFSAYVDDTTFFLRNEKLALELINTFDTFSLFSGLKVNKGKCEIAGIGIKNVVKVALSGMECIDLTEDTLATYCIYFSYNKTLELEKNFLSHIIKIQNILKLWKLRNLTTEARIVVFKSLAISKIIPIALVTETPKSIINFLNKIQTQFIWKGKNSKIKHRTLRSEYENCGLKKMFTFPKVFNLQCSWVKRLIIISISGR